MGRNNGQLAVYQIEILDFDKPINRRPSDAVIPDSRGLYFCFKCEWEGKRGNYGIAEPRCPQCGNNVVPKGKIKVIDTMPIAEQRTLITDPLRGKNSKEKAKRWASQFGTVISCQKVDVSPYVDNIEHLNLHQEPIELQIEAEELLLNEELEIELPNKRDF